MELTKKVIVIGDSGVGKTAFVARVSENRFISEYKATIGVDCAVKVIKKGDTSIRLSLWDIAGQDTYLALMPQYARGAAGIVMMCDVTRIDTINNIRKWKKEAEKVIGSAPPSLLLVNKFDLPKHIHAVGTTEVEKLADELKINEWLQTSVKENINLQVALEDMADLLLNDPVEDTEDEVFRDNKTFTLTRPYIEKQSCCS